MSFMKEFSDGFKEGYQSMKTKPWHVSGFIIFGLLTASIYSLYISYQ